VFDIGTVRILLSLKKRNNCDLFITNLYLLILLFTLFLRNTISKFHTTRAEESDLKSNQTVSSLLSCQRQILSPLDFIQEKGKQGSSYLLHNLPKLFVRRMS